MWWHALPPPSPKTSFLSLLGDLFSEKRNLRRNFPFSENWVTFWQIFTQKFTYWKHQFMQQLETRPYINDFPLSCSDDNSIRLLRGAMRNYDHSNQLERRPRSLTENKRANYYCSCNILFAPPSPIGKKYWLVYIELTFELGDIWVNRGM
jgi:hypothetical protein